MKIKAVMCDIDGTLLTSKQVVSFKTIQAIQDIRKQGVLFGLATGRDVTSVLSHLKDWGIEGNVDAIIGSGGAELYDAKFALRKVNHPLKKEHIQEIMHHFQDMDINFVIPLDGVLYVPKEDRHIRMLSKADHEPYKVVDFDEFLNTPRLKLMLVCEPNYMEQVVKRSKTFYSQHFRSASLVTAATLYEYMDPRVTKANGLKELMELHGYSMKDLCSFGDAENDIDMTQHAGIGVVMKNGSDKTKAVADYITDDNDHDGIANFLIQHKALF